MGISIQKIRKWKNMMLGKSVYHVNQGIGQCYSKDSVKGYYNDFTEKIRRFGRTDNLVPETVLDNGETMYFSSTIFQYGLGAYDLYLMNNDQDSLTKVINCANWAVDNQSDNGGWITLAFENKDQPYSAMSQGEGISLLIRAHIETKEEKYLHSAKKALEFMLTSTKDGGVTKYEDDDVLLCEYTYRPLVLNGWIFALWGLYDYCKYFQNEETKKILEMALTSLSKHLPRFDTKYWSKYDIEKRIASPFYHNLHIAQLRVMYDLFGDQTYKEYADKWGEYQKSFFKPKKAFIKKAWQKIFE